MKKNKAVLSIILIIIVVLIGVATIFISTKVSQEQAIAPTAPTVNPFAAEGAALCSACNATTACATGYICDSVDGLCKLADGTTKCWVGSTACTVTAGSLCVASSSATTKTCSPDCPTTCGKLASTISTCKDSCGVATTKACEATDACASDINLTKVTYKNESSSNPSSYTEISTVSKNQTFIYAILVENKGEVDATGINVTDTLNGDHQDQLSFVNAGAGCTYSASDKKVTCNGLSVKAGETKQYNIRVKVGPDAVNGDIIKNTAVAAVGGTDISATNEVTISTIVGCNHVCTTDEECSSGLICDAATGKCRKDACVEDDTCVCAVAPTARPTVVRVVTQRVVTEAAAPAERPVVVVAEPTVLPETGILDFPGVAAFGGGLLLAVVGILLAL